MNECSAHSLWCVHPDDVQVAIINALFVFVRVARAPFGSVPRIRVPRRSCDVAVGSARPFRVRRRQRGCRCCGPRAHARALELKRALRSRDNPVQRNS